MSQDISKVKGFNKLLPNQRKLLEKVHKKHLTYVENKENWEIVSAIWKGSYIKVTFKNGVWLHYTINGTWY